MNDSRDKAAEYPKRDFKHVVWYFIVTSNRRYLLTNGLQIGVCHVMICISRCGLNLFYLVDFVNEFFSLFDAKHSDAISLTRMSTLCLGSLQPEVINSKETNGTHK